MTPVYVKGLLYVFVLQIVFRELYAHKAETTLDTDHWGTYFIFSFLHNGENFHENQVHITTNEAALITIKHHSSGFLKELLLADNSSHIEVFDSTATSAAPFLVPLEKLAIVIESNVKISVYGLSSDSYSTDGFLALPVPTLGTEYVAVNYHQYGPQIVVIAIENDTQVRMDIRRGEQFTGCQLNTTSYYSKEDVFIDLNSLDVFNLKCDGDTTGTVITSNKPIAVLSGTTCSQIYSTDNCNHMVEMLPPMSALGTEFVFRPFKTVYLGNSLVRAVATEDSTKLHINSDLITKLNAFQLYDMNIEWAVCIKSDKPILLVMLFSVSSSTVMTIIPHVTAYTGKFHLPSAGMVLPYTQYIIIISPYEFDTFNIFDFYTQNVFSKNVCGATYYIGIGQIGKALIYNQEVNKFCLIAFGVYNTGFYGFPAGMMLKDFSGKDECSPNPCYNNGWCLEIGSGYHCRCPSHFGGNQCEIEKNVIELYTSFDSTLADLIVYTSVSETPPQNNTGTIDPTFSSMLSVDVLSSDSELATKVTLETIPDRTIDHPVSTTNSFERHQIYTISTPISGVEDYSGSLQNGRSNKSRITNPLLTPFSRQRSLLTSSRDQQPTSVLMLRESSLRLNDLSSSMVRSQSMYTSYFTDNITQQLETNENTTTVIGSVEVSTKSLLETKRISKMLGLCSCKCLQKSKASKRNSDTKKLDNFLKVDRKKLSKTYRRHNSAENQLQSEQNLGISSVLIVLIIMIFVIWMDIIRMCKWLNIKYREIFNIM